MGGGAEGYEGLGSLAKYYLVVKDHFEYWFIYMNLDLWKELSDEEKDIIQNAAVEMEARRYEVVESEELASLERLKKQGANVIHYTDDQIMKIRKKIQENVWPLLRKDIGVVFDEVVSSVNDNDSKP
jgi:TRAP-type C4-dicarboxylate transport system substrate-binding protein